MNLQRFAIVIVCLVMFAFGVSAPAKAEPDGPYLNGVVSPPCDETEFNNTLNIVQGTGGGTITFDCGFAFIYFTSQKVIYTNVTIDGGNKILLDGQKMTRHFVVQGSGRLTLKNILLANGSTQSAGYGGSIYLNSGTALFTDNAIFQNNDSGSYAGSAIIAAGDAAITLNNTTVQSNTTMSYGAVNSTGPLTVTNSVLRGNYSKTGGGAISASGDVLIQNTTLYANKSAIVSVGTAIYYIGTQGHSLKMSNSTIASHSGIAIRNNGLLTIQMTTFSNNEYAIQNAGGAELINVTLSNNKYAVTTTSTGLTILTHVTLFNNINQLNVDGSVSVQNTVFTNGACNTFSGKVLSRGNNVASNSSSCGGFLDKETDRIVISDGLGPLADNGGPTLTHLPQAGSPLIDAGACIAGITTDQRGLPRPQGLSCDIGAVEVQPTSPNPIVPRARIPIVVK